MLYDDLSFKAWLPKSSSLGSTVFICASQLGIQLAGETSGLFGWPFFSGKPGWCHKTNGWQGHEQSIKLGERNWSLYYKWFGNQGISTACLQRKKNIVLRPNSAISSNTFEIISPFVYLCRFRLKEDSKLRGSCFLQQFLSIQVMYCPSWFYRKVHCLTVNSIWNCFVFRLFFIIFSEEITVCLCNELRWTRYSSFVKRI